MAVNFLNDKVANSPAKYLFQLHNPDSGETLTLKNEPLEWGQGVIEIFRDIEEGGVFTYFTVDSLTFIKEGAKFLKDIWDAKEMNGRCDLIVKWFKFSTQSYIEMPSRFALNFATFKPRVKVGNTSVGATIETVKEEILVKIDNNKTTKVDISKHTAVNGAIIIPYSGLKKDVVFGEMNSAFQSIWVSNYSPVTGEADGKIENNDDHFVYTQFEMLFNANDFDEAVEVPYETNLSSTSAVTNFFGANDETREITFYYSVIIEVTDRKGNFLNPQNVYKIFFDVLDSGLNVISSTKLGECGGQKGTFSFDSSIPLTLAAGQYMRVYIRTDAVDNVAADITYSYFRIKQDVAVYTSRTRQGFPLYESMERVLQLITGSQYPFYSEFLGRTDVEYNQNGDKYSSEDQKRFAHIFSGLNLRGAILFDTNNPLALSFQDLYKMIKSVWNVGRETEERDGFSRIRIENYDYFFEDVLALDLSGRINHYDIETEAMPELAFSKFKTGYEDFDYESINGRGEFNVDTERTGTLQTEAEFDNISPIRADTKGITEKLIDELDTEDTEEDNSLFILKTQRSEEKWKPEKEENITVEENTSLFGADTFNLYLTPLRNLLRQANRIKGAYLKFLSSKLRFQTSSKLQTLKTTGEGITVTENQDYTINDLDAALYKPIKHTVTCYFTLSDFETLMQNKKGYIKFTDTISGYLLNLKKQNDEDRATIEIIEKV